MQIKVKASFQLKALLVYCKKFKTIITIVLWDY